ncbi:MAG TPA: alpha/beta hydrolase [bacterium]|nr:alpha/beta hydrolase [bacterium]HPN45772.1 alpha/beta hydrolase [bacterium]
MTNLRKYGPAPYRIALLHGGPGAAGEMAPVARNLGDYGVLEPLQTADTLTGQVQELQSVLTRYGEPPVTLVGFSWGAWLAFLTAAEYPYLVKKLVLISCPPFSAHYATEISEKRLSRLDDAGRAELNALHRQLASPLIKEKDQIFAWLGMLYGQIDAYDLLANEPGITDLVDYNYAIYKQVWKQASALRSDGMLLPLAQRIQCPVVAIHGDYDPHPVEGVRDPLTAALVNFRFILLEKCGHAPWREKHAAARFIEILRQELGGPPLPGEF